MAAAPIIYQRAVIGPKVLDQLTDVLFARERAARIADVRGRRTSPPVSPSGRGRNSNDRARATTWRPRDREPRSREGGQRAYSRPGRGPLAERARSASRCATSRGPVESMQDCGV